MKMYSYKGAVYAFNNLASAKWEATTYAPSEEKAVTNLKFRFRKFAGLEMCTPIVFANKITRL